MTISPIASNELVWAYCEKCGRKFSKHQKGFERFCPDCHREAMQPKTIGKGRNVDKNNAWRLIRDPDGIYFEGATFGTFEIFYGLRYGAFTDGTELFHIKNKTIYRVKGKTLVNRRQTACLGKDGRLVYIPRKESKVDVLQNA